MVQAKPARLTFEKTAQQKVKIDFENIFWALKSRESVGVMGCFQSKQLSLTEKEHESLNVFLRLDDFVRH